MAKFDAKVIREEELLDESTDLFNDSDAQDASYIDPNAHDVSQYHREHHDSEVPGPS